MESSPNPIQFADLPAARTSYGLGTAVWSDHYRHHVEPDWWIALSGTKYVDYNLALIHGDRAAEVATQVLDEIRRGKRPGGDHAGRDPASEPWGRSGMPGGCAPGRCRS